MVSLNDFSIYFTESRLMDNKHLMKVFSFHGFGLFFFKHQPYLTGFMKCAFLFRTAFKLVYMSAKCQAIVLNVIKNSLYNFTLSSHILEVLLTKFLIN